MRQRRRQKSQNYYTGKLREDHARAIARKSNYDRHQNGHSDTERNERNRAEALGAGITECRIQG